MADVTLYGQIKGGLNVENTKVEINGVKSDKRFNDSKNNTVIRDFGSRVGFKGEEDLGNGLKTIWQVEQKVSLGGDAGGWSNRETFIGLAGDFGKVRVGNLSNYFDSDMEASDPWQYSSATPALGLGILTRMDDRIGASVRYDSPEFAGFSGAIQYKTSANSAADKEFRATIPADEKGRDQLHVGLAYENSGFFAKYGFGLYKKATRSAADSQGNTKAKDGQVHRLEGGYDANNLFVSMAYQYAKGYDTAAYFGNEALGLTKGEVTQLKLDNSTGLKRQELALTAAYTIGAVTPRISYAHGWDAKEVSGDKLNNTKYDQVVIGADYALSKRTTALVSAGWLKHGLGNGKNAAGDEVKNKFTQTAASVGLKHVF